MRVKFVTEQLEDIIKPYHNIDISDVINIYVKYMKKSYINYNEEKAIRNTQRYINRYY